MRLRSNRYHSANIQRFLQEAAIEIGKVCRLLLAAENGDLSKYKGKSLDDIQIEMDILRQGRYDYAVPAIRSSAVNRPCVSSRPVGTRTEAAPRPVPGTTY